MSEIVSGLASSQVFQSAALAFFIAQFGKVFTARLTDGKWDPRLIVSSGGMPSSHAALVCFFCTARTFFPRPLPPVSLMSCQY